MTNDIFKLISKSSSLQQMRKSPTNPNLHQLFLPSYREPPSSSSYHPHHQLQRPPTDFGQQVTFMIPRHSDLLDQFPFPIRNVWKIRFDSILQSPDFHETSIRFIKNLIHPLLIQRYHTEPIVDLIWEYYLQTIIRYL